MMNPKEIKFIINGKRKSDPKLILALEELRAIGIELDIFFTKKDTPLSEAFKNSPKRVVAGGGDGTINMVLNEILKLPSPPELAILPLGTANDFASSAGIPFDIKTAVLLALNGQSFSVDTVRVNDRFFLNVATGGFGAVITTQTPPALKNLLGGTAYALTGILKLFSFTPIEGKMVIDNFEVEGKTFATAVCNGKRAGGGVVLSPVACIDDGLLDIVLFTFDDIPVPEHLAPPSDTLFGQIPFRKIFRASKVKFIPKSQMRVINLDGEPYSAKEFEFEILPKRLNLVLPKNSPLLGANSENIAL